jgi:hypothetical protein
MSYILKNTSGLVNTRVTDAARQKMSQGNFNISYFQVGDSEVSYNTLPNTYNQSLTNILEPNFNSQNSSGQPQSNKQNVKYPYYVDGITGNTYGIPYMDSIVSPVYNRAPLRGFFTGNITAETINWSALTNNQYVINSNYIIDMSSLNCTNKITLINAVCNPTANRGPSVGDFLTIFYNGKGMDDCYCDNLPTPTPTPTPTSTSEITTSQTPTPTPTKTPYDCNPSPTPTPSKTPCLTPSASRACPPPPPPDCKMAIDSCHPMMTYRIVAICDNEITLDRPTPNFGWLSNMCYARVLIYPPNMTTIYDSFTPRPHWADDVINYESICDIDQFDVKVWNMNIPWSESPAGLFETLNKGYTEFGSISYLGTKEYLGYASSSGQTDSDSVYYYNSFDEQVIVTPEEQKAIAIIHYTNNTIDFFYGEKFAFEPFDPENVGDTTGEARNFKLHIPWLMWHKNPNCCNGQTFWVDPPDFEGLDLFEVNYIQSTKNIDMNSPGIRYYHLWDNNPNLDGYPNRVGKVFPDQKIVVIDDEEIIAAMSYKSNRNWTLPAPKISLITPNVCGTDNNSAEGLLTGASQYLHVTYRFTDTDTCLNSLHCNYYVPIQGPNIVCLPITSQNVGVRFGDEFPCLNQPFSPITTTTTTFPYTTTTTTTNQNCYCWQITVSSPPAVVNITNCFGVLTAITLTETVNFGCSQTTPTSLESISTLNLGLCDEVVQCGGSPTTTTTTICPDYCNVETGFYANKFEIICQVVDGEGRPESSEWRIIDFTNQLTSTMINGYITKEGLINNTFVITKELYEDADIYNLNDYIELTPVKTNLPSLNFGDEYYFYGSLETDIQATIYEMRYKVNLGQTEFQTTSNPTWTNGNPSYITEIGLYDSDKTLMIVSKLQSPVLRQGIQQFLVKFDF